MCPFFKLTPLCPSPLAHLPSPCCTWLPYPLPQAPILVDQGQLRGLERCLWADTSFLARLGVMDYSLLVGESSADDVTNTYSYIHTCSYI